MEIVDFKTDVFAIDDYYHAYECLIYEKRWHWTLIR